MEYLIYDIMYLDISYDFCHHIFQTLDSNLIYGVSLLLPLTFVGTIHRLYGEKFEIVRGETKSFGTGEICSMMKYRMPQLFYSNTPTGNALRCNRP